MQNTTEQNIEQKDPQVAAQPVPEVVNEPQAGAAAPVEPTAEKSEASAERPNIGTVYLSALQTLDNNPQDPTKDPSALYTSTVKMAEIVEAVALFAMASSRMLDMVCAKVDLQTGVLADHLQIIGIRQHLAKAYNMEAQFCGGMESMVRHHLLVAAGVDPNDEAAVQSFFESRSPSIVTPSNAENTAESLIIKP